MQIAILGLGRFGAELALTLADEGHEVLGINIVLQKEQKG